VYTNPISSIYDPYYMLLYIYISVHTVKKNAEGLVVATKETGLDVNADKTKYMVMSQVQNKDEVTV